MTIIEDMGQKVGKHSVKNNYWKDNGINVVRHPLPTGDYCLLSERCADVINRKNKRNTDVKKMDFLGCYNIVIDTKEHMQELYGDLIQSHDRFRDELILAQNNNIQLFVLTENEDNITCVGDILSWNNPRYYMWKAEIIKLFIKKQKELYTHENALLFFKNRNIDIGQDEEKVVKKKYFDALKEIPLDQILEYLKKIKLKHRKRPADNQAIVKAIEKMQEKYGVKFLFCTPEEAGEKVIELLTERK